jgi:DNA-binding IscR family transcriptional regulator
MISLKAFLPELAGTFGTTPHALYERQRALVRLGLVETHRGRGPGSGAKLSADNVAGLVIALMLTENLSDTDARVGLLCKASPRKATCPLTGSKDFRGAIAALLGSPEMAARLKDISVRREELSAHIQYGPGKTQLFSAFRSTRKAVVEPDAILTMGIVGARSIRRTAELLANALSENGDAK